MNEKEARKIVADPDSMDHKLGLAEGYLEGIDKAKGLEEALERICYGEPHGGDNTDEFPFIAKEALAEYRRVK